MIYVYFIISIIIVLIIIFLYKCYVYGKTQKILYNTIINYWNMENIKSWEEKQDTAKKLIMLGATECIYRPDAFLLLMRHVLTAPDYLLDQETKTRYFKIFNCFGSLIWNINSRKN